VRHTQRKREDAVAQHATRAKRVAASLTTEQILLQRYATPLIPIERVRQDFFPEYSRLDHMLEAVASRIIDGFPEIVRLTGSGKGTRFVRLSDFARFLDAAPRPVSLPVSQD
jgi:hypothetical protein